MYLNLFFDFTSFHNFNFCPIYFFLFLRRHHLLSTNLMLLASQLIEISAPIISINKLKKEIGLDWVRTMEQMNSKLENNRKKKSEKVNGWKNGHCNHQ